MGGADGRSRQTEHPDFVTDSLKVTDDLGEHRSIKACNVLPNEPPRSVVGNDATGRRPEVPFVLGAELLPGDRVGLTGESPDDGPQLNPSWFGQERGVDRVDIVAPPDVRPLPLEGGKAERLPFDLSHAGPADPFEPEFDPTDP